MRLVIPGEPVPKARPRFNSKTGRVYTPATTRSYEEAIAFLAMADGEKFGDQPVRFQALFFTENPKTDCDNLIKSTLDGLMKGGVVKDDKQIVEIHAAKVLSSNPRTELSLEQTEQLSED